MTIISVIVGSTRQGRFSEKPAQWILQHLRNREEIEATLLDLRDFAMPFFDQPMPPAIPGRPPYTDEIVQRWTVQIAASDGFVFVTPEYNYGASAVLKNALDWVYQEWNRKAAAFVSYGGASGGTNKRTDIYGGSLENRARFLLEVTDAAISVWGAARVSVRLWPRFSYNGMGDSDPEKTYLYAVEQLEKRKLGILHFVEMVQQSEGVKPLAPTIRKTFSRILVLNFGYNKETAEAAI